ncbi:hypothetical protein ETB97_008265 [Aspergillus alliaceus]|uniref:ATP-dependent DNA ligase family profile domain-containing protein n=1 Tax=Petromyces alliaceus TaxID=209559 RepID=A0A8H6E1A5_PETAA|nr:hypothetical protein ETB97_008265 [Aspergillus burnettii]
MGFKFSHLCDLLSSLENNKILKATTEARNHDPDVRTLTHWFQQHGKRLRDKDTDQLAVLSCMFPEKRVDRVYWLQDTSLARVIGRCLLLGSSRREELDRWRASGGIDLAQCVENVMRQAENHILEGQEVTVEEIDAVLNRVASRSMQHLSPVVGVKIGRPDYYKARSIKHCCQMIGRRRMSMERKYDGEYCQIHIDLSKHSSSIRIFSKSGKDSTADRSGVHQVIRDSLRIGKPGCKFSRRCILEGELLVWSDRHGKIMDFHKLRKFITRSGTFIGTEGDSPPQLYEHLMIVFFDLLLLDDDVCLRKPHRERRLLLKDVIQVIAGRADISEQRVLDFCRPGSQSQLESIFAKGVAERWEGFVLKGCEEPYFTTFPSRENGSYGRWIKLKKDYIPGLGDTVDLAIIGGRYDSRDAVGLKQINKLSWTHFFIGCLVNKDAVLQSGSKPKFRAVDLINHHCMSVKNMQILNQFGEYSACGIDSGHGFDIEYGANNLPRIDAVFKTPFVVEMLGSGFEKPSGARYYTLRFPRILKIHWDRSFEDAASFKELQLLAEDARSMPSDELLEENEWNKRLKLGNGSSEYIINRSQSLTSSSGLTQSPVKGHILNGATQPAVDGTSIQNYSSSPVKEDSEGPPALARPIPIYVDETIVSISSDNSDIHGNFLTTNDNLSSHQISYQKNNVSSTDSVKQKNSKPSDESENSNASTYSNMSSTQTNFPSTQDLKALKEHADILTCSSRINNPPPQKPLNPIKSLHMTLPIHIIQSNPPTSQIPKINLPLTYIPNMNTFLKSLTSNFHKPHLKSTPALGLLLLKPIETPLGPTLLDLTTALYKRLQPYSSNSPTSGKIFLLDSSFLDHGTVITDPRLSHRTRWEEIGRKHFYASVSWGSKGRIDEIPCTPSDGGYKGSLDLGPRVSIEFDRGALGIMELNGPLRVV